MAWASGDDRRRAAGFAVTVLCLLLACRLSDVLISGEPGQVPFTLALFVLPLLCAVSGSRRRLTRYRWPVLAVQAVLTWVPFAVFGGNWQQGIDGLLAGLLLLMVAGPVSWLLAGGLLAADVAVRAAVTGLPAPGWYGVLWVAVFYVDDAMVFFGMVRLAQVVNEVEEARGQAAGLAVARERLHAARSLQMAVGRRLAGIGVNAAAARCALAGDAARARAEVAAAGAAARKAIAEARALAADRRVAPGPEPAEAPGGRAVIGARLASAVLVTVLVMFGVNGMAGVIYYHSGTLVTALSLGDIVVIIALQLYVSWAVRDGGRPGSWPVILAVQAVLVYAFSFGFSADSGGDMAPFLAASVLLLVPGRQRWTAYAAVVVSSAVLYAALPLSELGPPSAPRPLWALLDGVVAAEIGLMVYGLSRLAWRARELEGLRDQLARMAAVRERLRVARDVHDLLGLGLSAVALKADLVEALLVRGDPRAVAELEEMSRICAAAQTDIRQVTGEGAPLSLGRELDAAREILASAGVEVRAGALGGPLPVAADEVLAPVLREAVTNILRHAAAKTCNIELTVSRTAVRLTVSNDGVPEEHPAGQPAGDGSGRGLANMRARVQAAAGLLSCCHAGRRFTLTAEIPLAEAGPGLAVPEAAGAARPEPVPGSLAPSR